MSHIRTTDGERADVVAEGLTKIAENPPSAGVVARRLLARLEAVPPSDR